jgi:hypothetical protein
MDFTVVFQLLTTTLPVVLVILGYYHSKNLENLKENRKIKAMLFSELIQVSHKFNKNSTDEEKQGYIKNYSEIVEKLCLYANEDVLKNISKINRYYIENNGVTNSIKGQHLYSQLVLSMRRDVGLKTKSLNDETISGILAFEYFDVKSE